MNIRLLLALALATSTTASAQDTLDYFGDVDGNEPDRTIRPEVVLYDGEVFFFDHDTSTSDVRWWRESTNTWNVLDGDSSSSGRVNGYVGYDGIKAVVFDGNLIFSTTNPAPQRAQGQS